MLLLVVVASSLTGSAALSVVSQHQRQPFEQWVREGLPGWDDGNSTEWESGIGFEMDFWEKEASKWKDTGWATFENWKKRPFELQDKLLAGIEPAQKTFNVLDVGAGPVPALGGAITSFSGATLNLTATDPLADRYREVMAKHGITSPVPVVKMMAEDIDKHFPADFFDMAYSRNALDHAKDPMAVIRKMVKLVKPGHQIVIFTYVNEAAANGQVGFHKWNFANVNNKFILWGKDAEHDIGAELGATASRVVCNCCNQATRADMQYIHKDLMKCMINKA